MIENSKISPRSDMPINYKKIIIKFLGGIAVIGCLTLTIPSFSGIIFILPIPVIGLIFVAIVVALRAQILRKILNSRRYIGSLDLHHQTLILKTSLLGGLDNISPSNQQRDPARYQIIQKKRFLEIVRCLT